MIQNTNMEKSLALHFRACPEEGQVGGTNIDKAKQILCHHRLLRLAPALAPTAPLRDFSLTRAIASISRHLQSNSREFLSPASA
jgi:hypothetical protein